MFDASFRVGRRRTLGKIEKASLLEAQSGRCFYCGMLFGEFFMCRNRLLCVRPVFDHVVPFSYCLRNDPENYVAALCPMQRDEVSENV